MSDVDSLRAQLRDRGYLTHGIERWFALDPWSSRTFWAELAAVALKAALLIATFAAVAMTAIMVLRNHPLHALETTALFLTYAAVWLVAAFTFVVAVALLLKLRPALPIDTPRALLAVSLAAAALLVAPVAIWWWRFDAAPARVEALLGVALLVIFFLVATTVTSAALLSFSIYELHRIPALHQKPRGVPMTVAAALLVALLFVPAYGGGVEEAREPMVVTTPTARHVALVGVDGLTYDILRSRPDLLSLFHQAVPLPVPEGESTSERWASIGTGVRTEHHRVRAIAGVRFHGGSHVLQRISSADFILFELAPALGVARREPLPPTVRRREYVWEIVAERGMPAAAVNWWASARSEEGALRVEGPETIFTAARGEPLQIDAIATTRLLEIVNRSKPQLAAIYLPALDVILNRVPLDQSAQLAQSLRALYGIANLVALLQARGYEVILAGVPGEGQSGAAVVASTMKLERPESLWDAAPTLLELLGFPLSSEMPGRSRTGTPPEPRITTYGTRSTDRVAAGVNEEYYQNLESLGYIQ